MRLKGYSGSCLLIFTSSMKYIIKYFQFKNCFKILDLCAILSNVCQHSRFLLQCNFKVIYILSNIWKTFGIFILYIRCAYIYPDSFIGLLLILLCGLVWFYAYQCYICLQISAHGLWEWLMILTLFALLT